MQGTMIGLLLLASTPSADEKPEDKLLGEWVIESITSNGQSREEGVGNRYIFRPEGRLSMVYPSRFGNRMEGTTGNYKHVRDEQGVIDLDPPFYDSGSWRGHDFYIWKVQGDTLMLCKNNSRKGAKWPEKFEATANSKATLYVLRRPKPKPAFWEPKHLSHGGIIGVPFLMLPPKYDGKGIVGEWYLESFIRDQGEHLYAPRKQVCRFAANGTCRFDPFGNQAVCNPNANPPSIDFFYMNPRKPTEIQETILGIYHVEGDSLFLRTSRRGELRPTGFSISQEITVLKRMKKKE